MDIRFRKILRDILARKRRTFLISSAIFLGVAGTIALFTMGDILLDQLQEDVDNENIAMLNTFVNAPLNRDLQNSAYIEYLETIIDIRDVQGSLRAPIRWKTENSEAFSEGFIFGYDIPFEDITLEAPRLIEGDYPQLGQVALEIRFAQNHDLNIGDSIVFQNPEDASQESFIISGILLHAYNLSPERAMYAQLEDANRLSGTNGYNILSSRFVDYKTAINTADHFSATLLHDTPYTPLQYQLQDPTYNPLTEGARRVSRTINLLAVIALVMSSFSVTNVINKIVREQKYQIGLMKAIGASRSDLIFIYMGIAFIYGLLGVLPGLAVGIPSGYALAQFLGPEVNTVIDSFRTSPRAITIGVLLGLVIPMLSALVPVLSGTRATILQAVTDRGIDKSYHRGVLAKSISILPLPVTLRMGLHELNKKKMRLLLTMIALAVAVGSFMGILAVFNGVNDNMNTVIVEINQEHRSTIRNPNELRAMLRANINLNIFAPDYDTQMGLRLFNRENNSNMWLQSGRLIENDDEIIASHRLMAERALSIGDKLTLRVADRNQDFAIVGVAPFPIEQVWMADTAVPFQPRPNAFATTLTKTSDASLVDAVGFDEVLAPLLDYTAGQAFSADNPGIIVSTPLAASWGLSVGDTVTLQGTGGATTQTIVGIFNPPSDISALDVPPSFVGMYWEHLAEIEGYEVPDIESLDAPDSSIPSFSFLELLENFSINIGMYRTLLSTISLLIGLVGGLGLLTTLSLSVIERQREIGVMRSIGADSSTIASQFVIEGLMVGLVAWILGLPLSVWIADRLLIVTGLETLFTASLRADAALTGLFSIIVLSLIASLWPALIAASRTVSEVLRYQ